MARLKLAPARKRCRGKCGKVKPITAFARDIAGVSGEYASHWSSYCLTCNHIRAKEAYYGAMTTDKLTALEAKTVRNLSQIRDELARREGA
jgi:hypothetical protein